MRRRLFCLLLFAMSSGAIAQISPNIGKVSRNFGPTIGGTVLTITGDHLAPTVKCFLPCPTTVMFGDTPAILKGALPTMLHVVTPSHAPGTVDITVNIPGEGPIILVNAFTFTTSAEAHYERVLLPLYFDGVLHGAFGSEWTTSLWIRNNGSYAVDLAPWSCPVDQTCLASFPLTYELPSGRSLKRLAPLSGDQDGNPSRLLYLSQSGAADVSFSLRFADQSRGLTDAGIDLPVVREKDALYGSAQLFNVPLQSSFRVMLRLYELGDSSSRFRVTIYPQSELDEQPVHSEELTATVPESFSGKAGYAQLDVTGLLRIEKTWPGVARIEITPLTEGSRYWSFVSLTNNDTQIVTLVTPH